MSQPPRQCGEPANTLKERACCPHQDGWALRDGVSGLGVVAASDMGVPAAFLPASAVSAALSSDMAAGRQAPSGGALRGPAVSCRYRCPPAADGAGRSAGARPCCSA